MDITDAIIIIILSCIVIWLSKDRVVKFINDLSEISELKGEIEEMALDFTELNKAVANETTVEASAVVLITQFAQEIAANAGDQQAIHDLADKMNQSATALATAVAANTPAAPATPSTPATPAAPSSTPSTPSGN
jgi:peptidoglycan hydrolase CwlO-like protein